MADIFVSYKKEDFPVASRVVRHLIDRGYSVWWDHDLTPRTAWDVEIERQLVQARAVLVLWSASAVATIDTPRGREGTFVRKEAQLAADMNKYVPARIERCDLPLAFRDRQTADLSSWDFIGAENTEWQKVLGWIAAYVDAAPPAEQVPVPSPKSDWIGSFSIFGGPRSDKVILAPDD